MKIGPKPFVFCGPKKVLKKHALILQRKFSPLAPAQQIPELIGETVFLMNQRQHYRIWGAAVHPPPPSVQFFLISCSLLENLAKSYVGAPGRSVLPPTRNSGSASVGVVKPLVLTKNVADLTQMNQSHILLTR